MDPLYRRQRHVYDLTRKYVLLGRDRLIRELDVRPGDRVLEVGCGTARNLLLLARRHPGAAFCGLDASPAMLQTAAARNRRARLENRITLGHGLAETADYAATFGSDRPFDAIFFSYSLSMIPDWRAALEQARGSLAPGRALCIVDFWDQANWPAGLRRLLRAWLGCFHVTPRPELLALLQSWQAQALGRLTIRTVARRYAFLATFIKNGA